MITYKTPEKVEVGEVYLVWLCDLFTQGQTGYPDPGCLQIYVEIEKVLPNEKVVVHPVGGRGLAVIPKKLLNIRTPYL